MISCNASSLLLLPTLEVIFAKIFLIHPILIGKKLPETKLGLTMSMNQLMLNLTLKSSFNSFRIILSSILVKVLEKYSQLWFSLKKLFKVVLKQ